MAKPDFEAIARAAGFVIGRFGSTQKWWRPAKDDGARYCADNPRSTRYICEDYGLA